MPENLQLDAFLAGKPAPDAPPAEPPVAAEPAVADDTPPDTPEAPQAAPEGPDEPSTAEPEKETREPQHFRELRTSVEAAKREREDWKSRAVRAETERDELRRQFEAASRAPAAPAAPAAPQMDIREAMAADPSIKAAVLTRLDTSEMILRREIGDEAVNALQADFTAAMGRDPTLQARVLTQRDPYRWAHKHMQTLRLQQDIGDDPAGYEARMRERIEAEIMAGRSNGAAGNGAARVSPAAGMAPSLAQARSAAPRSASGWTGPQSLDQILAQPRK